MDDLIKNIGKIHTTKLGAERIKRNLDLDAADVVDWCKTKIGQADEIIRKGKNWYVYVDNIVMTVNAHSYTIITAHKTEDLKRGNSFMQEKVYEYDAVIQSSEVGKGGAYVPFPYDIRAEFGKGRVKVHATFDGEPYDGSIVNMGVKNPDGSVCYILGMRGDIRAKISKQPGDTIRVTIWERE